MAPAVLNKVCRDELHTPSTTGWPLRLTVPCNINSISQGNRFWGKASFFFVVKKENVFVFVLAYGFLKPFFFAYKKRK